MKDDEQKIEEEIIRENAEELDTLDDVEFVEEDSEGVELSQTAKIKKLRLELKDAQKERTEYLTGWQRSQADYVNLKKEATESLSRGKELGREQLFDSLMPALDSFSMAMGNRDAWEKVEPTWRQGIEYIYNQLVSALAENGITVIDSLNVSFDPLLHESVETVYTDDQTKDHTIESVIQKGYKLGDKVLRPARVRVYTLE